MSRHTHNLTTRPRLFAALAAVSALTAAALLAPPVAGAAPRPVTGAPQTTVYYSAHELASDRGTQALYQRIVSAARSVCPRYDSQDLTAYAYSRKCQQQAVARAIRRIGNPRLAAVRRSSQPQRG
jgi:UrcA family protein